MDNETTGNLNSLKDIANFLREKADKIEDVYLLNAIKLLKAADILDPPTCKFKNKAKEEAVNEEFSNWDGGLLICQEI